MWQSLLFRVIKSTAKKEAQKKITETIQNKKSDNGYPKRIWLYDISKENILKADPLSFLFCGMSSFTVTPFSRQVVLCQREKGPQHKFKTYSLVRYADPATLAYSCASLCQYSCIMSG